VLLLLLVLLPLGILLVSCSPASPSKAGETYRNDAGKFAIDYTSSLAVREYPTTKDGAGFGPVGMAADPANEVMAISFLDYPSADTPIVRSSFEGKGTVFSEYVKTIATKMIESFIALQSIKSVPSTAGGTCYETTWQQRQLPGVEIRESLPIVYCYADASHVIQFSLEKKEFLSVFEEMARSIRVVK